jgi:transcription antitermination protein NusB
MADKRHIKRTHLVQALYAYEFHKSKEGITDQESIPELEFILKESPKLIEVIAKHAPKYPVENIARVDRAILMVSLYELIYKNDIPAKVIINEAVEIAKEMGGGRSYAFINGVLGSALKEIDARA